MLSSLRKGYKIRLFWAKVQLINCLPWGVSKKYFLVNPLLKSSGNLLINF